MCSQISTKMLSLCILSFYLLFVCGRQPVSKRSLDSRQASELLIDGELPLTLPESPQTLSQAIPIGGTRQSDIEPQRAAMMAIDRRSATNGPVPGSRTPKRNFDLNLLPDGVDADDEELIVRSSKKKQAAPSVYVLSADPDNPTLIQVDATHARQIPRHHSTRLVLPTRGSDPREKPKDHLIDKSLQVKDRLNSLASSSTSPNSLGKKSVTFEDLMGKRSSSSPLSHIAFSLNISPKGAEPVVTRDRDLRVLETNPSFVPSTEVLFSPGGSISLYRWTAGSTSASVPDFAAPSQYNRVPTDIVQRKSDIRQKILRGSTTDHSSSGTISPTQELIGLAPERRLYPTLAVIAMNLAHDILKKTFILKIYQQEMFKPVLCFVYKVIFQKADSAQWQRMTRLYTTFLQEVFQNRVDATEKDDICRAIIWISEILYIAVNNDFFTILKELENNARGEDELALLRYPASTSPSSVLIRFCAGSQMPSEARKAQLFKQAKSWLVSAWSQDCVLAARETGTDSGLHKWQTLNRVGKLIEESATQVYSLHNPELSTPVWFYTLFLDQATGNHRGSKFERDLTDVMKGLYLHFWRRVPGGKGHYLSHLPPRWGDQLAQSSIGVKGYGVLLKYSIIPDEIERRGIPWAEKMKKMYCREQS